MHEHFRILLDIDDTSGVSMTSVLTATGAIMSDNIETDVCSTERNLEGAQERPRWVTPRLITLVITDITLAGATGTVDCGILS